MRNINHSFPCIISSLHVYLNVKHRNKWNINLPHPIILPNGSLYARLLCCWPLAVPLLWGSGPPISGKHGAVPLASGDVSEVGRALHISASRGVDVQLSFKSGVYAKKKNFKMSRKQRLFCADPFKKHKRRETKFAGGRELAPGVRDVFNDRVRKWCDARLGFMRCSAYVCTWSMSNKPSDTYVTAWKIHDVQNPLCILHC